MVCWMLLNLGLWCENLGYQEETSVLIHLHQHLCNLATCQLYNKMNLGMLPYVLYFILFKSCVGAQRPLGMGDEKFKIIILNS